MPDPAEVGDAPELFRGGLLYRVLRRHGVDPLEALPSAKRAALAAAVAWVVTLGLSFVDRGPPEGAMTFLRDAAAHVRMLVVLPLLLIAEPIVARAWRVAARRLVDDGLVPPEKRDAYHRGVARAVGWADHPVPEVVCALFGAAIAGSGIAAEAAERRVSWFLVSDGDAVRPTAAGVWYVLVLAVVLFLLFRWVWRLILWHLFLWRVSRLGLHLYPTHSDRAAGLGFLIRPLFAYAPLTFAMTASLAGTVWNRLTWQGVSLEAFAPLGVAYVVFVLLVFLAPLLAVLVPLLARARRLALEQWGRLAAHEGEAYFRRWQVAPGGARVPRAPDGEEPEAADLEAVAVAVEAVQGIKTVPLALSDVGAFLVPCALPVLPLLFAAFPAEEVLRRLADLLV